MKKVFFLVFLFCFSFLLSQKDSIFISAQLDENLKNIHISQTIKYTNPLPHSINKIKLLNWIAAYRNTGTPLAKRKAEDRNKHLHFSKKEDLGYLKTLKINNKESHIDLNSENLYIYLNEPLLSEKSTELNLEYTLSLPKINFTEYGTSKEKLALKYFFLVPDGFENHEQSPVFFNDIEETQSGGNFWNITIKAPENYHIESNLMKNDAFFSGTLSSDPVFFISEKPVQKYNAKIKNQDVEIVLGYHLSEDEKANFEFYLPLHLEFIYNKIKYLPKKIFISERFKKKELFFGKKEFKFWKFNYQMFTDEQKIDLDYFGILAKSVLNEALLSNKNNDHWLNNGLKTYLEIQYLNQFYADTKLLGNLPETVRIFGLRPLNFFNLSKLNLTERYGIAYQYIMSKNLDQKIGTPYVELNNFNQMAISNFETGSLLDYIAQRISHEKFNTFLQNFIQKNQSKNIDGQDFLTELSEISSHSSDFLEHFFNKNHRMNFKLKKFEKLPDGYLVKIAKNSPLSVPVKLSTENENQVKNFYWFDTEKNKKNNEFFIPNDSVLKIQVNDYFIFPESNFRDNYLYTKGLFSNTKKIKFKLVKDFPDPEYNEIYLNPSVNFNAYDKILLGINFHNRSLLNPKFLYSITPYFSTGTGNFMGSGAFSYSFRPTNSIIRNWQIGVNGSHFHYDYNLSYQRTTFFSNMTFRKKMRSDINRSLIFSYNYFEKDLTPKMIENQEYSKYSIWNLGYAFSDNKIIHEKSLLGNFQLMEDFQKISAEAFYRWEFAHHKKVSFRVFAGTFLSNQSRNDFFNFGISRVSNYAFSYSLLGQSSTSGILSQQYIFAEGGFKSYIGKSANRWIITHNVDMHIWKMFNLYADLGLYKNKSNPVNFIWDSGVKLKIIPDFLEIYFPIQSTLGFEPGFKDYKNRIRYTFIFNINAITNHLRRGWY